MDYKDLPAWIQAICSVFLVFAIFIPIWLDYKQTKERRLSILAVVKAAYTHACNIREWSTEQINSSNSNAPPLPPLPVHPDLFASYDDETILNNVVKDLQSIPIYELGSAKSVFAMRIFIDHMIFLKKALKNLLNYYKPDVQKEAGLPRGIDNPKSLLIFREKVKKHLDFIDKNYLTLKKIS